MFVTDSVLELAGVTLKTVPDEEAPDPAAIDEAVGEFRRVLDAIDPADLAGVIAEQSVDRDDAGDGD